MALPVAETSLPPQHTTVAKYEVYRLGPYPYVRLTFVETNDALEVVPVAELGPEENGHVLTVRVPAWYGMPDVVGRVLLTPAVTITGFTDGWVTFAEPVPAPTQLVWHRTNRFGQTVSIPAPGGKSWEILLQATDDAQVGHMVALMRDVMAEQTFAVLAKLDVGTIAPEAVYAAVDACLQEQESLDTYLAEGAETVELLRRSGTLPTSVTLTGLPPAA